MLTRHPLGHAYSACKPNQVDLNGVVKVEMHKGIVQTWAIARPSSYPTAIDAPDYLGVIRQQRPPDNRVYKTGTISLAMLKPNLEMDPSDAQTWQRLYRFS